MEAQLLSGKLTLRSELGAKGDMEEGWQEAGDKEGQSSLVAKATATPPFMDHCANCFPVAWSNSSYHTLPM
jgi:hypothetical protein